MRSEDIVISARDLGKVYRLFHHPGDRVKQFLSLGFRRYHQEFTALRNVSFHVRKGEVIGIIGRNGSGKSTLLQLICGILRPSSGTVEVRGRIAALLELGAGFNPEFTGRENVYFHCTLMGYPRTRMDALFEEIATFADIGEFIDQPVRIYSSGMFVRLAFAAAVMAEPDILVIDEALAVGDAVFQARCLERIRLLKEQGTTILLVSHSMSQILSAADAVLVMDGGRVKSFSGDVAGSIAAYEANVRNTQGQTPQMPVKAGDLRHDLNEKRFGSFEAQLLALRIIQNDVETTSLQPGKATDLLFHIQANRSFNSVVLGVSVRKPGRIDLWGDNNLLAGQPLSLHPGLNIVRYRFAWPLTNGEYFVYCGLAAYEGETRIELDQRWPMTQVRTFSAREQVGDVHAPVSISIEG